MTCNQMGGPDSCTVVITGSTAGEMIDNGMGHIMQEHPDLAEQMQENSKEANNQWMTDFQKKFDAAPGM